VNGSRFTLPNALLGPLGIGRGLSKDFRVADIHTIAFDSGHSSRRLR
jgi:hypothetical protein